MYGAEQKLDRIDVLFSTLRLQMFNGAQAATGADASATKVARRRWTESFAQTVAVRLRRADIGQDRIASRLALTA